MILFDSHCHLTDERFAGDLDGVVKRAREAGLARIVTVASDPDDALAASAIARSHPGIYSTAGIHPHAADQFSDESAARILEILEQPEVVALGETGLDYHYDFAPRERQRANFEWHLRTAAERGYPVIVHAREADDDMIAMVREHGPAVRGVLHCFASGEALLDAGLGAGWYISFSGLVTFRNYDGGAFVRAVPPDRLLVETDSPYLAPVPFRGRRNEPAFVARVGEAVAMHRGEDPEEIASRTSANASRFYALPEPGSPADRLAYL